MKTLFLVRHAKSNRDDPALADRDRPLAERGRKDAPEMGKRLARHDVKPDLIVSSPALRALTTAEIAASALGLPVETDPGLREVSFGEKEGQPMDGWFPSWIEGKWTPEGAESFAALRARAVAAVRRALAFPPVVLVVAHGSFFRAIRSAMELDPKVRWPNGIPTFCRPPGPDGGTWSMETP